MNQYSDIPDTVNPDDCELLSEFDVITPEEEARAFLQEHPCSGHLSIRYGIVTDYDIGVYDARTAINHLIDYGRIGEPDELMKILSAGIKALAEVE